MGRGISQTLGIGESVRRESRSALVSEIEETCKRIYRLLTIDGYARIDLRLAPDNKVYFIEANPNPILASDEDFALSAGKAGLPYPQLIDRIVRQGMKTVRD